MTREFTMGFLYSRSHMDNRSSLGRTTHMLVPLSLFSVEAF